MWIFAWIFVWTFVWIFVWIFDNPTQDHMVGPRMQRRGDRVTRHRSRTSRLAPPEWLGHNVDIAVRRLPAAPEKTPEFQGGHIGIGCHAGVTESRVIDPEPQGLITTLTLRPADRRLHQRRPEFQGGHVGISCARNLITLRDLKGFQVDPGTLTKARKK